MTGQGGDHYRTDRTEARGHHPVRGRGRVDPAGGHGREAAQRLRETRHVVRGRRRVGGDRAVTAHAGDHRQPLPAHRRDHQRRVGEMLSGQLRGRVHAAAQVQGGQQGAGRGRQERRPLPLRAQGFPRQLVIGVVGQPPHHRAVTPQARMRLEAVAVDQARDWCARRLTRPWAGHPHRRMQRWPPTARREPPQRTAPRPGCGQQRTRGGVAQDDRALRIDHEGRVGSVVPQRAVRCRVGLGLGQSQKSRTRWANPSPHPLEETLPSGNHPAHPTRAATSPLPRSRPVSGRTVRQIEPGEASPQWPKGSTRSTQQRRRRAQVREAESALVEQYGAPDRLARFAFPASLG